MRAYITTTVAATRRIFAEGFADSAEEFGMRGVHLATRPLGPNDGFMGEVFLCIDVPEEWIAEFDVTDGLMGKRGHRVALVPAARLDGIGKPQVYDHQFAGMSRRDIVKAAEAREIMSLGYPTAADFRSAVEFFDEIGWLAPLRLREGEE